MTNCLQRQSSSSFLPRRIPRLTILGLGKSIYDFVCLMNETAADLGEIWTINAGGMIFRHDVLWDMHTDAYLAGLKEKTRGRILLRREKLRSHDKPIVMPDVHPDYPTSVAFPLDLVVAGTNSTYFANGMAYMLAMAMLCEVRDLNLFGTDFSYDRNTNSHDEQGRACCEYWVGRLVGKGVAIHTTGNSHFMDSKNRVQGKIYGYDKPLGAIRADHS